MLFILTQKFSHVYKNGKATSNCNNSDKSVAENTNWEYHLDTDIISSDDSSSGLLKLMLLFGLLTLNDSSPAAAASDLASGLNSVSVLGDFGDIRTGFASVRKISLHFYSHNFLGNVN